MIAPLLCAVFLCAPPTPSAEEVRARPAVIGSASIPGTALDKSGLEGDILEGFPHARLGGIGSAIDAVEVIPGGIRFIALGDRGPGDGAAPFACRYQRMTLHVDPARTPAVEVTLEATVLLRRPDGEPFSGLAAELGTVALPSGEILPKRFDPEALRILPSANLLIADEYGPAIMEFDPAGAFVRTWPIPSAFQCTKPGPTEAAEFPPVNISGRQPNRGFEGLAITPKGTVWAILQNPLIQDGALNAKNKRVGRNIRMLGFMGGTPDGPMKQVVYPLEGASQGVNEILALDETRFLVIERDGSAAKFRRVYMADISGATDVSAIAALPADALPAEISPARKTLLIDLADPAHGITTMPEKIEGLCFGPTLADGRRTLVIVSDNDLRPDQATWFWVFALPQESSSPAAPPARRADPASS